MKISSIDIQNFRKLKCCHIGLGEKETVFVGANNSGKTSASDALIKFLEKKRSSSNSEHSKRAFYTSDFTLSNWKRLNLVAESWSDGPLDDSWDEWHRLCPSIDVWIKANSDDINHVCHLIPNLKWQGGHLGVRLAYLPKDLKKLRENFLLEYCAAQDAVLNHNAKVPGKTNLELWPRNINEYLDRKLTSEFEIKAYLLDPKKFNKSTPQTIPVGSEPLESYPFSGLFKVDVIEAQRGFYDPDASNSNKGTGLSTQLNEYYRKHLNPSDLPGEEDLDALKSIDEAKTQFDKKLEESFGSALGEVKGLGYPGFSDPDIRLSSRVDPVDGLDHDTSVIFNIQRSEGESLGLSLPEKYNGLGYKNLIYMIFRLISFRDGWQRTGKLGKRRSEIDIAIEPIHLVLIEEPEVHLHAQVQQVFIRKAYEVLRKKVNSHLSTQLLVSTHSSNIAHEVDFDKLRYFKRVPASLDCSIPTSKVVDLSNIFGDSKKLTEAEEQTAKFVARYIKTTHCDLFFANGVILVEGAAERMLLPHFIKHKFDNQKGLNSSYVSILEVGGAHAHRLKSLIVSLDLPTLIITDTDAKDPKTGKKTQPKRKEGYVSGSDTLNKWFDFKNKTLDELLDLGALTAIKGNVCAVYQKGIYVKFPPDCIQTQREAIPYTFEDAIALSNIPLLKNLKNPTGMLKKMQEGLSKENLSECCEALYDALSGEKAKMALDLLFDVDPEQLDVPKYIYEGLEWLENKLTELSNEYPSQGSSAAECNKDE